MIGQTISHYQIVDKIGEGGMGEVYLAEDSRLDRQVAVKILPADFARDSERRQRFEREARVISTLSHPNICVLHDIGEHDGRLFLVMEYLEGDNLAERLDKGPLPSSQVLRIGAEIGEALASAHSAGIVHRDLKPANVVLTASGAKLLDFGLAGLAEESPLEPLLTALPTEKRPLTEEGTLLGTYPYMAPEQLEGRPADPRTDIFALGSVLHEMATGQRAFEGETRASLIASILQSDPPPVSSIQPLAPTALDHIVRTCLAKDPEERWQNARDVASQLRWIGQGSSQTEVGGSAPRKKHRWPAALAAALVLSFVAFAGGWLARTPPPRPIVNASISLPFAPVSFGSQSMALSPDGDQLSFAAFDEGNLARLWIRRLGESTIRALPGTEGATYPFWSPDSRQIGFFAKGKLKTIASEGGAVFTVADAPDGRGGAWNRDDVIVFSPRSQAGLVRVSASGGNPLPLTKHLPDSGTTHRWPRFLSDDEHLLFFLAHDPERPEGIYVTDLESGEIQLVAEESSEVYVVGDRVLYHRDGNVLARRFDLGSLQFTGSPQPVAQHVRFSRGRRTMGLAASERALVYRTDSSPTGQLTWFDRDGKKLSEVGQPDHDGSVSLAPDGKRALVRTGGDRTGRGLYMLDTATGDRQRFSMRSRVYSPSWSPDGRQVAYMDETETGWELVVTSSTGAEEEAVLYSSPVFISEPTWSAEGQLAFSRLTPETGDDIWTIPANGSAEPRSVLETPAEENPLSFSPDGRLLAFTSDKSGQQELYVMSFPDAKQTWQLTSEGFAPLAVWSADGSEIGFYAADGASFIAWTIGIRQEGRQLDFGPPRPYLGGRDLSDTIAGDFTRDLDRMLIAIENQPSTSVW
jgi:serine/threonine protein kinase